MMFKLATVTQHIANFSVFLDCVNCPVDTFILYTSKLDPSCPYLWQRVKRCRLNYTDPVWFESRRMGHNPLETFMKNLCEEANLLSKEYTNHSIRATCISHLDTSGFEARHIAALSSHKSEATIREYSVKCPENKRKEMFNALAVPMKIGKKIKSEAQSTVTSEEAITPNQVQTLPHNNNVSLDIPFGDINSLSNIQLLEMDSDDDNLLSQILNETEKELAQINPAPPPLPNLQSNRKVYLSSLYNLSKTPLLTT